MSSSLPTNGRWELLGLIALAALAVGAVTVSIFLMRANVRGSTPQIALVQELPRVSGGTLTIDEVRVDGKDVAAHDLNLRVRRRAAIDVRGWAVDSHEGTSAAGVVIFVDGKAIIGGYGLPRPDVEAALGGRQFRNSGFEVHLSTLDLAPGKHTVAFGVVAHSGIAVDIAQTSELTLTK